MIIRKATDQDIPAIVQLLKLSLGESLMPKSETFWNWKHVDNPFGSSPVLVAEENNQLIGVRAFMRWEWKYENKIYKAVRAVDTATHPDHQGKGIFKKLTLQLVDQCRKEGVDFIFNTPNTSSKPGYLKMGWMSNGKMVLNMHPRIAWNKKPADFEANYKLNDQLILNMQRRDDESEMRTSISTQFLKWRYVQNPNIEYYGFSDHADQPVYFMIFRLKPYRWGVEFRICDSFHSQNASRKEYREHLREVVRLSGANLVTMTGASLRMLPTITASVGPEITTHPLTFDRNFLSFRFWKPSLGDMELF
jgi:N-acetylglutamate synthase-like GNAT family acetyltransferase